MVFKCNIFLFFSLSNGCFSFVIIFTWGFEFKSSAHTSALAESKPDCDLKRKKWLYMPRRKCARWQYLQLNQRSHVQSCLHLVTSHWGQLKLKNLLKPSREWQSVRLINNTHPCYNINLFQFQKLMVKGWLFSSGIWFHISLKYEREKQRPIIPNLPLQTHTKLQQNVLKEIAVTVYFP